MKSTDLTKNFIKISEFKSWINKHLGLIVVIILYLIASFLWSLVELLKLYSFDANVYDLGVGVSALNSIARTYSIGRLLTLVPSFKPFALIISYITLIFPTPEAFLYLQAFGTLLASIFIYLLAKKKYNSYFLAVLLSLSFIFFFPISWYLFDNFHIAGFFSTFFFAAIYFSEKKPKLSFVLYLLASSTNLVLAFFVLFYFVITETQRFVSFAKIPVKNRMKNNWRTNVFILTPVPTLVFAIWRIKFSGLVSFNGNAAIHSQGLIQGFLSNFVSFFNNGFILLFMISILFIVIFTTIIKRSELICVISILPVVVFILFGGYLGGNFLSQYNGEYFTPIIYFIILIPATLKEGGEIRKSSTRISANTHEIRKSSTRISANTHEIRNRGVLLFILLVIFMGIFYNPYAPGNNPDLPGMNAYANFYQELNVSLSDSIANKFVSLVPSNMSVLVDDIEPQFSDRPRNFLFGPGNLPWINSTFFYDSGPKPSSPIPQFIAVEVSNVEYGHGWYYANFYNATDGSMSTWFPYFYSHYQYGLLAYSFPYYLYKLNYSGIPVISSGMNFIGSNYVEHEGTATIFSFNENQSNLTLLNTVYKSFLLPTNYSFSFGFTGYDLTGNISIEAINGVSTFKRTFNVSDFSGQANYTLNIGVLTPSDYTFRVVTSGLKGEITKYSSENLAISYF